MTCRKGGWPNCWNRQDGSWRLKICELRSSSSTIWELISCLLHVSYVCLQTLLKNRLFIPSLVTPCTGKLVGLPMKELNTLLHGCTSNVRFPFTRQSYWHKNEPAMCSPLDPLFTDVVMTNLATIHWMSRSNAYHYMPSTLLTSYALLRAHWLWQNCLGNSVRSMGTFAFVCGWNQIRMWLSGMFRYCIDEMTDYDAESTLKRHE